MWGMRKNCPECGCDVIRWTPGSEVEGQAMTAFVAELVGAGVPLDQLDFWTCQMCGEQGVIGPIEVGTA